MFDFKIIHSTVSGKLGPQGGEARLRDEVATALGPDADVIEPCGDRQQLDSAISRLIKSGMPRVAVSGGDGFSQLFYNVFFQIRERMQSHDYRPQFLFLAGGTGNAISCFTGFRNNVEALKSFMSGDYRTEPLNLLEVNLGGQRELVHNVSFGGDGAVLINYNNQKQKGLFGYILAVLKYAIHQKYVNPFSRKSGNFIVDIEDVDGHVHRGNFEGGGAAVVPYVGYKFKPYPLCGLGNGHMRFVNLAVWLMPTIFRFTNMRFPRGPRWLVFEKFLNKPNVLKFKFNRAVHVQVCGDYRDMHESAQVDFSQQKTLDFVKKNK